MITLLQTSCIRPHEFLCSLFLPGFRFSGTRYSTHPSSNLLDPGNPLNRVPTLRNPLLLSLGFWNLGNGVCLILTQFLSGSPRSFSPLFYRVPWFSSKIHGICSFSMHAIWFEWSNQWSESVLFYGTHRSLLKCIKNAQKTYWFKFN